MIQTAPAHRFPRLSHLPTSIPDTCELLVRLRWMWHKKWCLPKLTVAVDGWEAHGEMLALVSAGTLRDGHPGLHDQVCFLSHLVLSPCSPPCSHTLTHFAPYAAHPISPVYIYIPRAFFSP